MAVCSLAISCGTAQASSTGTDISKFVSNGGTAIYLVAAAALPLVEDGKQGKQHFLRIADAAGTSVLLSEGLQRITNELRPDGTDRQSLPSTHATAAFAAATMESAFHPRQAVLWYTGATLIAASRVALHRHYIHDVIAGAALGYGISRWELSRPHGLLLFPLIEPSAGEVGLSMAAKF